MGSSLIPPAVSYPGVYIQEVNNQPLTVPAVPTSLTAFVGRAKQGPVNTPVMIESAADFARTFGGLWEYSELSYAVNDFFDNGGAQALVVRLFVDGPTAKSLKISAPVGVLTLPKGAAPSGSASVGVGEAPKLGTTTPSPLPPYAGKASITLDAASPGIWGNQLQVSLDQANISDMVVESLGLGLQASDFFNLHVTYTPTGANALPASESHNLVTLNQAGGPFRLDRVLKANSQLVSWKFVNVSKTEFIASWQANFLAMKADSTKVAQTANPAGAGGNDGYYLLNPECYTSPTLQAESAGLYALDKIQLFNLLVIPRDNPDLDNQITYPDVFAYLMKRRAFWILDSPIEQHTFNNPILHGTPPADSLINAAYANPGQNGANAAVYFPDIQINDPLLGGHPRTRGPAGMVAGIYARTDAQDGIWKAPAGQDATLMGINTPALHKMGDEAGVPILLNDEQSGIANLVGINCLMNFPVIGSVVWGARTLEGNQQLNSVYKYVPVRRLTLWIEQELKQATRWAVFQPNDETLWSSLRLQIGGFLHNLWKEGAFMGAKQTDAYYVQCDATTTSVADQYNGVVNVVVGIAPVRPAKFVVIYIQQILKNPTSEDITMAATINVSANRIDPYKTFKFKVKWDGKYVAGVSKVSAMKRTTDVIKYREGGSPAGIELMPGQTSYEAITLEAGVTTDVEFEQWANKVWYYPNTQKLGNEVSMQDLRKNITIEVYNEAGQKVLAYNVYNCWPSEYTAMPELDAQANSVAIQTLTLQNEGWTRDDSVKGATQLSALPQYTEPSS